jgi:hypothetical protein
MPDDLTRRDVLIGIASVTGAAVLPAPDASAAPVVLPWPFYSAGCLTAYAAPAVPRATRKLPRAIDVMMPNPSFDEFSIFGKLRKSGS